MNRYLFIIVITSTFILSGCSDRGDPQIGPYASTEIVSEEPAAIGYIVDVLEEEQVIFVKSGIAKEEAMEPFDHDTSFNTHSYFSNSTMFDGELKKGYKVAVWVFEEEQGNIHAISEKIMVLEK